MIYINKNQDISQIGKNYLQEWLNSFVDEEEKMTFKDCIKKWIEEGVSANKIWDLMLSKPILKRFLIIEQGFVCCYCGQRIFINEKTPIEHLAAKTKHKDKIFQYENLMASCSGSAKRIIHIVKENTETITTIANRYNIPINQLEEFYVNDTNYEIVRREYDFDNLKIGDRV